MKKLQTFKLAAILSLLAVGPTQARHNDCEGPLDSGRWYIMPKIGAAPGIFANRGYEQRVQILGGADDADRTVTCVNGTPVVSEANQYNALQQNSCKIPKFGQVFSNGVLHVGFELGRNVCDNTQMYFEFVYNRASGKKCVAETTNHYVAPEGCASGDCSTNCSTPIGNLLGTLSRTTQFGDYTAYGIFVGTRHYWDWSLFCDRISLWSGFKVGLFHRKSVDSCSNVPEVTVTVPNVGDYLFAARENINTTVFCKNNSVAGGVTFGFDYCFNDCLTFLVGVEVIASSPFKSNNNVRFPLGTVTPVAPNVTVIPSGAFPQPTNVILGNTGTFVQFPVWVGFRWEFDFCKSSC